MAAHSRPFIAFEPVTYDHISGKPQRVSNRFSVLNPNSIQAESRCSRNAHSLGSANGTGGTGMPMNEKLCDPRRRT